ncbi:DUF1566 domain-containing protein [Legionella brunensis]|uniref:Protein with a bacterial immunoglobulin-like domain protein n=1 Tax=Legionella brunensis TaxID=29422 RepID=A0A0W0SU03_9GAMM|nr:DUF1566 domain-containing protein [Legionella brunensis]KTC86863.1 protein with a bacterial immunoglobulin-like domain protein [Legionella brunensis]
MQRILTHLILTVALLFLTVAGQAGSQPKFLVEVKDRAPEELVNNGIGFARYKITNSTGTQRRLTMVPISGVQVMSSGCSSVFTLDPGHSCYLYLRLIGRAMGAGVHTGPVICKTKGDTNVPDRFLCSQAPEGELLNVTIIPTPRAIISVSPTTVTFTKNGTASITITNSASSARSAENVMAHIPSNSPVRVRSTTCRASLAPGARCQITFTSAAATSTTVIIQGTNTNAVNVAVLVMESFISLSSTSLTFMVNDSGTVRVTNTSNAAAERVAARIPATSSLSVVSSTCPARLAPRATCTIEFTGTAPETTQVTIRGTNTNTAVLSITVAPQPVLTVSPLRAVITADGSSTQTLVTVTNTSTRFTARQVSADLPPDWGAFVVQDSSDCVTIAPGASCTLAFSSAFRVFNAEIGIPVSGDNTATTTFGIAFFTDGGLVYDVDSDGNIWIVTANDISFNVWANSTVATGATDSADGDGNTSLIVATPGITAGAAVDCDGLVLNGFSDWYLPAIDQLTAIYTNLHLLDFGSFSATGYWSSTENSGVTSTAAALNFANGVQNPSTPKGTSLEVRCARLTGTS